MGSRGCAPWGPTAKPLVEIWEQRVQKLTTVCENMLLCTGFKMHVSLYESIQYEMEEKSIWRQKSGLGQAICDHLPTSERRQEFTVRWLHRI